MESPYSSSWGLNPYPGDTTGQNKLPDTAQPTANLASAQTHDVSLSELLPDFFIEKPEETQPVSTSSENGVNSSVEETVMPPLPPSLREETGPATPDLSQTYAWLTAQEKTEERHQIQRERMALLIKIGAVAIVIALVAILLIVGVATQAR